MQIAVKETAETEYWLIILEKSGFWNDKYEDIKPLLGSVKRMLIATLNTAKGNN
ncbi:MAG: four helix bundle protein [Ruminococcus sp.]|nr:four helix bundle protein [Ruminococcus sp.]